jgi:hypothetical protein
MHTSWVSAVDRRRGLFFQTLLVAMTCISTFYIFRTITCTVTDTITTITGFFLIFCWPCISVEFLLINNLTHIFLCIYLFPFITCFEKPSVHHQENWIVSIHHLAHVTLCRWLPVMPDRHTRQSAIQSDICQMMYWYNSVLLMMNTGFLETCREGK